MSNNLESDRAVSTNKMFPIDLAPQKITIVKNVSSTDVKMAHLLPGQPKTSVPGAVISHTGPTGLMRPSTQIVSSGIASQPQMIVSGSPVLQGATISQGLSALGQSPQIITQSQLINTTGLLSPGTQIISQGTQLTAVSSINNTSGANIQGVTSVTSGTQVLNVGGQLVTGSGNLVVSSSVRTLPPSVRVLPQLPHHNTRPAVQLSTVTVSSSSSISGTDKGISSMPSHVPRGLAAGASLAVRQLTPAPSHVTHRQALWAGSARPRGALYARGRPAPPAPPAPPAAPRAAGPAPAASQAPPSSQTPPTLQIQTPQNQTLQGQLTIQTQPLQNLSIQTPSSLQNQLTLQPQQSSLPLLAQAAHSAIVTLPSTTVLTSSAVLSGVRPIPPRSSTPNSTSRPLPLLPRNYQAAKVVGVTSVGVRAPVGNSAPAQLYYEVPRAAAPPAPAPLAPLAPLAVNVNSAHLNPNSTHLNTTSIQFSTNSSSTHLNTSLQHLNSNSTQLVNANSTHINTNSTHLNTNPTLLNANSTHLNSNSMHLNSNSTQLNSNSTHLGANSGLLNTSAGLLNATPVHINASSGLVNVNSAHQPIRQVQSSQSYLPQATQITQVSVVNSGTAILDGRSNQGATVVLPRPALLTRKRDIDEAMSKAAPRAGYGGLPGWEDVASGAGSGSTTVSCASTPPDPAHPAHCADPAHPARLLSELCDYQPEERPPTPPQIIPPKRPQLSATYVCGWRATALHFTRPADVRRRAARARGLTAIAAQRHVLASADGWKLHHLTAQMDDLVSLEADVGDQLQALLKSIDAAPSRAHSALQNNSHAIMELLKGNVQRSKIVCESVREAREDILRVFTHRNFVSDILSRQADKRCFRKHRSQS